MLISILTLFLHIVVFKVVGVRTLPSNFKEAPFSPWQWCKSDMTWEEPRELCMSEGFDQESAKRFLLLGSEQGLINNQGLHWAFVWGTMLEPQPSAYMLTL